MARNSIEKLFEALKEDAFDISTTSGAAELQAFEPAEETDVINIVDPELDAMDDMDQAISDNYLGKLVAVCGVCNIPSFINKEDLTDSFQCPHCYSEGESFTVVGKVVDPNAAEQSEEETVDEVPTVNPEDIGAEETIEEPIEDIDEEPVDESLQEDLNSVTIDTDNEKITVTAEPKDEVIDTVEEPIEAVDGEAVVAPLSGEEAVEVDDMIAQAEEDEEYEFEDFNMSSLVNKFLKENYSNVKSFEITEAKMRKNNFIVEGTISFESGKTSKTSFVFENVALKEGAVKVKGSCPRFGRSKSFILEGKVQNKKLIPESLKYNFTTSAEGKRWQVRGKATI